MELTKTQLVLSWALRLAAAGILLQTLFFKFTGAEESKFIFSTLGVEPWGRIGSGVVELIAAALLFVPRTVTLGALLASGVMSGAILSHLTLLGIEVKNDRGLLFALAIAVLLASLGVLYIHRYEIPFIGGKLRPHAV
ncbi:DoxX family protein [bacterium]|nr:DoxX family protein [bacterium]RIK59169.1 MAG: DoxX family protein [candidate division KSB1 bacterium]